MTVWTIGHSTRSAAEFLTLLTAHGITGVADVRAFPVSRRHPHFAQKRLQPFLAVQGIEYRHMPALGGHRVSRADSPNGAWREEAFRGYADHLSTDEFRAGLGELLEFASKCAVSVMCAEGRWRECHRQLIADVLIARGVDVRHIMAVDEPEPHTLTPWARIVADTVIYPLLV